MADSRASLLTATAAHSALLRQQSFTLSSDNTVRAAQQERQAAAGCPALSACLLHTHTLSFSDPQRVDLSIARAAKRVPCVPNRLM